MKANSCVIARSERTRRSNIANEMKLSHETRWLRSLRSLAMTMLHDLMLLYYLGCETDFVKRKI
jgi:hypothetical protein